MMGINKVYFGRQLLMDLTRDTVSEEFLLKGKTAHNKAGNSITGSCLFDVDSSDATALSSDILIGETAYAKGLKITGTMPNQGSLTEEITLKTDEIEIPEGYHNGLGLVRISEEEKEKIIPENIIEGVTILGVTGITKPLEIDDFAPTLIFYDGIEDETALPVQDENGEQLLGAYVYHRA